MLKKLLKFIGSLISIVLFILAIAIIHHKLKQYHYRDVIFQLKSIPLHAVIFSIVLTVLNYLVLSGYDTLALHYIGNPLRYSKIVLASFIGYVFSHNATVLGGSAARYRVYSGWGASGDNIARVVIFCITTFFIGFLTLSGSVFLLKHDVLPVNLRLPFISIPILGILFLSIVIFYIALNIFRKTPLNIKGWELSIPGIKISLAQVGLSSLDLTLAAGVLFVLLPASVEIPFSNFLAIFLLSQMGGLISSVPAGLGVFESLMLLMLNAYNQAPAIIGCILVYRFIYYIFPLAIASVLLIAQEIFSRRELVKRFTNIAGRWSSAFTPYFVSFTSFVAGTVLLFSGSLPAVKGRLVILRDFLPLPAIEISHFLGSLAGACLIILSRSLQRRLNVAYHLTIGLLIFGIVLSLLKGWDYEEASILMFILIAFIPCRKFFHRKASILSQRFTPMWIMLIIIVLVCMVFLGVFSYKHVQYSNDLWWKFALHGDAHRFLRASMGAMILVLLYSLRRLLVPAKPRTKTKDLSLDDINMIETAIKNTPHIYANLAFLGDKEFVFSQNRNAFIMYGIEGRSWVCLGEPVGPEDEWEELLWKFRELCDQYDGWSVFYQVDKSHLDLYLDMGMAFIKIGEEAHVKLETFSLEGEKRRGLRHSHNKITKENCSFSIISPDEVPAIINDLKQVSDQWLASKNAGEKRFSLGYFNPEYLKRFPMAVVRREGKIVAFANILAGANKEELSVDLMRYIPEITDGIMDYLFVELMLWGKNQGYQWFNFGMAPLKGFDNRELAPLWTKVGAFIFQHGEHFYNFRGLRQYKDKFDPQWQPKFMAYPKGFLLPRILANIMTLISGGLKGIIRK